MPGASLSSASRATSTRSRFRGTGCPSSDAEDVFQEVFARAYENLPQAPGRQRHSPVARAADPPPVPRLDPRRALACSREESIEPDGVDDTIERLDEALFVHDALATLPDNCREILDRFFARDESYRHIGEALDLPAGTIASRISRCLVKLRGELEGRNPAAAESGG